jgi:hypothetical protein
MGATDSGVVATVLVVSIVLSVATVAEVSALVVVPTVSEVTVLASTAVALSLPVWPAIEVVR